MKDTATEPRSPVKGREEPPKRQSLSEKIQNELSDRIRSNAYLVGEKLLREKDLAASFKVSRTVIREALAQLRAEGLIEIRHGVGVFVCEPPSQNAKIPFLPDNLKKRSDLLELLELRMGVEIEASGLAALRRSPAQNQRIQEAFHEFRDALELNVASSEKDFELHRRIAEATNNRFYLDFLEYISRHATLEAAGVLYGGEQSRQLDQLKALEQEHKRFVDAISRQDAEGARQAMRQHLVASEERFVATSFD